nr:PREDICTED: muellerian-inhibiting factor [Latimeria chalumnae]|eukprot:XP_014342598.1 PREDICTED: muellerian-inhibiting factor [Latimeria chalumnae]
MNCILLLVLPHIILFSVLATSSERKNEKGELVQEEELTTLHGDQGPHVPSRARSSEAECCEEGENGNSGVLHQTGANLVLQRGKKEEAEVGVAERIVDLDQDRLGDEVETSPAVHVPEYNTATPTGELEGPVCQVKLGRREEGISLHPLEVIGALTGYESSFVEDLQGASSPEGIVGDKFGICPGSHTHPVLLALRRMVSQLADSKERSKLIVLHLDEVKWEEGIKLRFKLAFRVDLEELLKDLQVPLLVFYLGKVENASVGTEGAINIVGGGGLHQNQTICLSEFTRYMIFNTEGIVGAYFDGQLSFEISLEFRYQADGTLLVQSELQQLLFGTDEKCFTRMTPVLFLLTKRARERENDQHSSFPHAHNPQALSAFDFRYSFHLLLICFFPFCLSERDSTYSRRSFKLSPFTYTTFTAKRLDRNLVQYVEFLYFNDRLPPEKVKKDSPVEVIVDHLHAPHSTHRTTHEFLRHLKSFLSSVLDDPVDHQSTPMLHLSKETVETLPHQKLNISDREVLQLLVKSEVPLLFLFPKHSKTVLEEKLSHWDLQGKVVELLSARLQSVLQQVQEISSFQNRKVLLKLRHLLNHCYHSFNLTSLLNIPASQSDDAAKLNQNSKQRQIHTLLLLKVLQTIRAFWHKKQKLSRESRSATSNDESYCRLRELNVDLSHETFIQVPKEYLANNCAGPCKLPMSDQNKNYNSHVILLMKMQERGMNLKRNPCCIPVKYSGLFVSRFIENGLELSLYPNMVAEDCGCR